MKITLFLDVISIFSCCRGMLTFIEKLTQNDKKKKEKQSLLEQERMYNQKD